MKTIWCLFSIANNYDQPSNNLVAWFSESPTIDKLRDAIKQDGITGEDDLLVDVLSGHDTVVTSSEKKWGGTSYRLERTFDGQNV